MGIDRTASARESSDSQFHGDVSQWISKQRLLDKLILRFIIAVFS